MTAPARIAAFALGLLVVFGGAALAGGALDPLREPDAAGHPAPAAGHGDAHPSPAAGADEPAGLAVALDGYRLVAETTTLPRGRAVPIAFRVTGPDGATLTRFDELHEREMHLIVVRRDMTGYRHLHPRRDAHGRWSVRASLPAAGTYRAYADFSTDGRAMTLATDLTVPGPLSPVALPPPRADARDGRYRATLRATGVRAGATAAIAYDLSRAGAPLAAVEPYLGADGHLVALREGDLAFLHVHPEESGEPGRIRFGAELPSTGRYRLFVQFRHDGRVRTVAHTIEVAR